MDRQIAALVVATVFTSSDLVMLLRCLLCMEPPIAIEQPYFLPSGFGNPYLGRDRRIS